MAELFDTSKQNIGQHIANILKEGELQENSVVKNYLTTAADGKQYKVIFTSWTNMEKKKHKFPDTKISQTFLVFASPIIGALGENPAKDQVEHVIKIAFAVADNDLPGGKIGCHYT
jgi:hypothetical protein